MTTGPILSAVQSQHTRDTFFPTPEELSAKLLKGIDWSTIGTVLEPSAGAGDLAQAVAQNIRARSYSSRWRDDDESADIDCVEIDESLRAVLKEKKFRVVGDDFLNFRTFKRYDLIVMNPPFDQGAKHLLKALSMVESGGSVRCILNAETIRNPFSKERQHLCTLLNEYEARIEYVQNAFLSAQRKTGVEVALVSVDIPRKESKFSHILEALDKDVLQRKSEMPPEQQELIKGDYIAAAVDRYNYEVEAGLRLIRDYLSMKHLFAGSLDPEDKYSKDTIHVHIEHGDVFSPNSYIKRVRLKYWSGLFKNPNFIKNLTSNLQDELRSSVNDMADYDFSEFNIYSLRLELQKRLVSGIEETIMKLFEDWTRKYYYDEHSQNIHYFNGWKTNDAFAVNKKVIIPFYGVWSQWSGDYRPDDYDVVKKLSDIEKVFDYLGSTRELRYDLPGMLAYARQTGTSRKIHCTYFDVTFYKKGTCHIEFTDLDALEKFNLFAAKNKNWLPPCYGKKAYQDMSNEEQAVVDSFQGKERYAYVMQHADYFLASASETLPLLTAG